MQGSEAQLAYGFEVTEGNPGTTKNYLRFISESLLPDRPFEENPNMDSSNMATKGASLAVTGSGRLRCVPDVNSIARMRLHHRQWGVVSTPVAGVYQWLLRNKELADTAFATYVKTLFLEIYRGFDTAHLLTAAQVHEMVLKVAENKFVDCDHGIMFGPDTFQGPITPVAVNAAYTGKVEVIGHRSDMDLTTNFLFKVLLGGASGVATIQFKLAGGAYAGAGIPVTWYKPIEVILGDGTPLGARTENEKTFVTFFPGNAGTDILTIADEWTVDPQRNQATPVYSTAQELTAVGAVGLLSLGGGTSQEYALHNLELRLQTPKKLNMGLGSKYARPTYNSAIPNAVIGNGKERCTVTLQRDLTDLNFYRAMVTGKEAVIDINITGARIAATAYYENWRLEVLHGKVKKAGSAVGSANSLPESIEIEAFRTGTDPLLRETLTHTLATVN